MLNDTTDFIGNAIGIDPSGCGCLDCSIGNSIPENSPYMDELLRAHIEEGRDIVNRTHASVLLVYKDSRSGACLYEPLYISDERAQIDIIEEAYEYHDDYGIAVYDSYRRTAEYVIQSYGEDAEEVKSVDVNDDAAFEKALSDHFVNGTDLTNRTYSTLVVYESYGEYGHRLLDVAEGTEISIIRS